MINNYYIIEGGQELGPFTHEELMDRDISGDTLVLSPTMNEWLSAHELPEFAEYFQSRGIYYPSIDKLASFWWRVLAYIIDYIILIVMFMVLGGVIGVIMALAGSPIDFDSPTSDAMARILGVLGWIIYNAIFEATELGASIGKLICKMVVVDVEGSKLNFSKALSRNFAKILSSLFCGIGFLMVLWDKNRQGWHDQLAKTYVVRKGY